MTAQTSIDGLSADEKRRLLRELLARQGAPRSAGAAHRRAYPLTFAQERLWFLHQFEGPNPAYHLSTSFETRGTLDLPVLRRALAQVVRRHPILLATFRLEKDQPVQCLDAALGPLLPQVDLDGLDPARGRREAERLGRSLGRHPFDLEAGPLLRSAFLRLGSNRGFLVLVHHHIISDGWSVGILLRELLTLYNAFLHGLPSPLDQLPVRFVDFAAWQRKRFAGPRLAEQLAWWREHLGQGSPRLALPLDRPRPAVQTSHGATLEILLPRPMVDGLESLAKGSRGEGAPATLFMTLLAAFFALLHRISGQRDLSVGTPVAGRSHSQAEGLIGFFVNVLVLRTRVRSGDDFRRLLDRVRRISLESFDHQEIPFERIVDALDLERSTDHTPLFQVLFVLHNQEPYERLPRAAGDLGLVPLDLELQATRMELSVELTPGAEGLRAVVELNRDLYDPTTIGRLFKHYRGLIAALLARPDVPLEQLSYLSAAEQHQLLQEGQGEMLERAPGSGPLDPWWALRRGHGEAVAIGCGGDQISHAALDRAADGVGGLMSAAGIGPGDRVGIALTRSPTLLAALLGVWRVGAAYVPLDPAWPAERLTLMARDAGLALVLADDDARKQLPQGVPLMLVDADAGDLARNVCRRTPPDPQSLAYVLYTSGSTGRPKGVRITHGALHRFLTAMAFRPGLSADDRLLALTSLSFDIAGLELFLPLLTGARVEIAPTGTGGDPAALAALIPRTRATVIQATPATWQVAADTGLDLTGRRVLCGGEALPRDLARQLRHRGAELWNLYGPTETTVWSTVERVHDADTFDLGRPISHTTLYVVDSALRPVALGVAGELLIGGRNLSQGYLHRPALSAERFLPDPFGDRPGSRLYATGDLVRRRADGILRFLGRTDFQVKIRGHRIELGEIETHLEAHPTIARAVVTAQDGRLLAYASLAVGATASAEALRTFLAARLPSSMVPASISVLEEFPLTPNGKIDRRALTEHADMALPETGGAATAPRDPVERILADLWAEVLGVEVPGIEASFFALGGHSLLAARVVARMRRDLGVEISLRRFFQNPRLSALARAVREQQQRAAGVEYPPLRPMKRPSRIPLSFAQRRLWLVDFFEPGTAAYNLPIARVLAGPLDPAALDRAAGALVERHQVLRTTYPQIDERPVQVVAPPTPRVIPLLDLTALPPQAARREATRRLAEEADRPFDLAVGPVLRLLLLRLEAEEHTLAVNLHHIAGDLESMAILEAELAVLYDAFSANQPSPLPPLPVQYVDYTLWQRSWLRGELLASQVDHWRRHLAGLPAVLDLPTDRPRPSHQSYRGAAQQIGWDADLHGALTALGRNRGATLFMTLAGVLQELLARTAKQRDFALGVPVAGRSDAALEGLIGFFVNTLVLRTDLDGDPSFHQLLERVRVAALDAYTHQDLPFEKLVEELAPTRSLAHSPLFQVMLNLDNAPRGGPGNEDAPTGLAAGNVSLHELELPTHQEKFDLSLELAEESGRLTGQLSYAADLFDGTTIARLMRQLEGLARAVVASPDRPLSQLSLLETAEQHQLSATGDTDHQALAELAPRTPEGADGAHRPPQATARLTRTHTEEMLGEIWADLLDRPQVGPTDHFFELGGHSLSAARMVARLARQLAVELPPSAIFESPRLEDFARRVEAAAEDDDGVAQAAPALRARDAAEPVPLSFSQERLWFLDQWDPGTPAYNLPYLVRLRGPLRPAVLAAAWHALIQRHEALRTRFATQDDEPIQVVEPQGPVPFATLDLRSLGISARNAEATRLGRQEMDHSFDLSRLPMFRVLLVRMGDDDWLMMMTVHHIVIDGWSYGIVLREVADLYGAYGAGRPSPLEPLSMQYPDYALWQRRWLTGEALEEQVAYWRRRLGDGGSPALELPTDFPRPAVLGHRGERLRFVLGARRVERLQAVARVAGVTLHMALVAAIDTLLYRWTGQRDITLGTYVAGRDRAELEPVVGFFVNTLALRLDLARDPTFLELLGRTRSTALEAYAHQRVPFEQILAELNVERDLARTPLFQVMMVLQNLPEQRFQHGDITFEPVDHGSGERTEFELTFWLYLDVEAGVAVDLDYDRDLFLPATIERLRDHLFSLLDGIGEDPDRQLWQLPLMDAAIASQVLASQHTRSRDLPEVPGVHSLVAAAAERWPDAPALVAGGRIRTYGELLDHSRAVGRWLLAKGVDPGEPVAVCVGRSAALGPAVLGTLLAGAAYLPLDPAWPAKRLATLLRGAGVRRAVTAGEGAQALATEATRGLDILELDAEELTPITAASPAGNRAPAWPRVHPRQIAYLIYTSGSTGEPKAVAVDHRALLNHTVDAIATYGLEPDDRALQFASLSFDASVEEIFPTWCAGARLVLREQEMMASPEDFFDACGTLGITVLNLPTAWWHETVPAAARLPPRVRVLIIGGERALPERLRQWRRAAPRGAQLFNTYGPTEATVVTTRWRADEETPAKDEVPIGRPLANVRAYVLDRDLTLAPPSLPGELCIAGLGLAQGYFGRPATTAERFAPDPLADTPGERLYRSGDRARRLAAGELECLGRLDHQVKIRGYRVELGEIESALDALPAVREAVVVTRQEAAADGHRLIAYVGTEEDPAKLRQSLKRTLPAYMVPAVFVPLKELPKTAAGKLDRRHLPDPETAPAARQDSWVAPSTPSEGALAELIAELLGIEAVGLYDNFFDLGGHSLLTTRLRSRIVERFGVELTLQTLFETPTVAGLAATVEEHLLAQLEDLVAGGGLDDDDGEFAP